jgi:2-polyprenyl-3-methyl-5-hydroxy-6-metoxy-1,4-benzoquinol methylase
MKSRAPEHFERLYAANPDPWNFAASRYERDKYEETIAILQGRHFSNALEAGCSIGVLTKRLAPYCDALLGIDVVPAALENAARNCAELPHVRFARMQVPDEWPAQKFDLILLSEVLYFLTGEDIARLAAHCAGSLLPGGTVLLVNYLGEIDEPSGGGDAAAKAFIGTGYFNIAQQLRRDKYRIDLLTAPDP